jgi:hypothetical protein
VADLDEALRRHPPFVEARLARARLLVELDLANLASRDLVLLARSLPEPLHGPLVEARDHFGAERRTEALSALERAFRALPDDLAFMDRKIRTRPPEPEWSERATTLETANYVFKAERSSPERLKALGEVVEAALGWFPSILRIDRAPARKPQVYLFAGEESYASFAEDDPEGMLSVSAGKYLDDGRLILYEDGARDQTRTTLIHEAWHEYFSRARVPLPTWLNEGLAVYAGAAEFQEGRVTGSRVERGMITSLETAFAESWPGLSFAEIMGESHREFHGTLEWLQYCQSWSMIHFFRHGDDARRAGALQAYLPLILSGASRAKAFEQAFGKRDLPALQEQWRAYVRGLAK